MSLSQGGVCLSCPGSVDLGVLLPHLAGVIVEEVAVTAGLLLVTARARQGAAACPKCGTASARVPNLTPRQERPSTAQLRWQNPQMAQPR